ncbi:phosphate ABC transporter, inner membrane subunit PstC [Thermocrinis albus DSM 14484]|uniref:Phosphate transport system permease protein n=1 Tax=Thermocrinis albus (strain DSM 14484 / JCM 11386 / HI 11/12) TaxID=638303 RepID=D3SNV4_THEAH|nr:phosphate ABC transporter, inner membrane subunit PstC [Thermocrinis albus DSM 14484]
MHTVAGLGKKLLDRTLALLLALCSLGVGLLFPLLVLTVLVKEARLAINTFGLSFLVNTTWDPVAQQFGGATMVVGTLLSTFLSLLIAVPVAIGVAIFQTEMAPRWLRPITASLVELLASIPSIVYGMWGFLVLAPIMAQKVEPFLQKSLGQLPLVGKLFDGTPTGIDLLTTSVILSLMIMPFMASVIKDAFQMVPPVMKESAYAMGATRWEVIRKVVMPYTMSAMVGGAILATGRALGETMAVAFLAGNTPQIPRSLLDSFTTITVALANQFTEADTDLYLSSLYYLSLLLFLVSITLLAVSKYLLARFEGRTS